MKKKLSTVLFLLFCTAISYAESPRTQGYYIRVGAGIPVNLNLGFGYNFTSKLSLGIEATTVTSMYGIAGAIDTRYYFIDKNYSPFIDLSAGYGKLGQTLEYENYWDCTFRTLVGISLYKFDLGTGITYDTWNNLWPMAYVSYSFQLPKKN
ncbi:MAG: hypothetical protein MJ198_01390 [Bacteroidales bacterium]|nr:hypothetical protein [Bacteroidales bacterium]